MSVSMSSVSPATDSQLTALERRVERERQARKAAESLLSEKSRELYLASSESMRLRQRLQLALWASGDSIWEWSRDSDQMRVQQFLEAGERCEEILGSRAELLAMVHKGDREAVSMTWRMHERGDSSVLEATFRLSAPNDDCWMRLRGRAIERDQDGLALRLIGTLKDISEQRRSDQSLQLLGHAFASNRDGLAVLDQHWQIVECNQALARMVGEAQSLLIGADLSHYIDQTTAPLHSIEANGVLQAEATLQAINGNDLPVELLASRFQGAHSGGGLYVLSVRDISDRRRHSERMKKLALFDALTGLPNRANLEQSLDHILSAQVKSPVPLALLFLDLDGFKAVNDGLGHAAGDELLREVAHRIRGWISGQDFACRWGGDEFCVYTIAADPRFRAEQLATRLINVLSHPIEVSGHRITVTPSIGIALAPEQASSVQQLLKLADSAMYVAKRSGRSRFEFYREDLHGDSLHDLEMLSALRSDLEKQRLQIVAQPKVNLDGAIVGYETLMRWTHDEQGPIPPDYFIPLAEANGLIGKIGQTSIEQSIRFAAQLAARGLQREVALNLSPYQLKEFDTLPRLVEACEKHRIAPAMIGIEITESALIDNPEAAKQAIQAMKDLGFGIALDDFGTGYSSLAYLRDLPLDKVKIDRSFVLDVETDPRAAALLRGIVKLCHSLNMKLVAEGVETPAQHAFLAELGIDELQGYLFSRPRPLSELLDIQA